MNDVYFEGDPATDSTRRRLERILKQEPRPAWHWLTALAAGGTLFFFWQARRRRRRNGNSSGETSETGRTSSA